jgi:Methane oxygenase PmoA
MTSQQHSFGTIASVVLLSLVIAIASLSTASQGADGGTAVAQAISVTPTSDPVGWEIRHGDELLAGYRSDFNGTPIVFPLIAPGGHHATRGFPMLPVKPTEKNDHDHHRSLWMTHGEVNNVDFWIDDEGCGKIVQTTGSASTHPDTNTAVIVTKNDWNGPDGKRILSDDRSITFSVVGDAHIVDFDVVLHANDGPVHFGDTKEGSFGLRVPGTVKVDAKLGGKITNADGLQDSDAWGKHSPWVDYSGPVDDSMLSITIHNHPSSFHYPCRWHVRTYGLFAANPFGEFHFTGGEKTEGYTLPAGESLNLSYRVTLREADFDAAKAAADFEAYAKTDRPTFK